MYNDSRSLRRELRGWQIFFITIGGIIGIGFFTNAGEVLSVAGPGGTVVAFSAVGLVAFFVMEGICEMIVLWPIPNAMVEFVRTFVDEDLAAVIGIGYCYTYTVTFSALIVSAANLANYWAISQGLKSTIFVIAPMSLVILNLLWVEVFGIIEAVGGVVKLLLVAFVFILSIVVNRGGVGNPVIGTQNWSTFICTNTEVAGSKAEAILIAIPKVTFAYIGVELLTTTAYEAQDASKLKHTAMFIVPVVCVLYVAIATAFVSNVPWNDPRLPQIFGQVAQRDIHGPSSNDATTGTAMHTSSALPIIALVEAGSTTLASILTGIFMYSGLSAANTALYVASRTLYGFARNIDVNENSGIFRRALYGMSTVLPWTEVPLWGVIAPAAILCWLPFLHLSEDSTKQLLQEVLLNIGSVSAVLVWFTQCLAYIFYWRRRQFFRRQLGESNDPQMRRLTQESGTNSLLAVGQPVWAILGAIGTFTIVFVFNSVVLWNGKLLKVKFFAAFLSPILMGVIFLIAKVKRTKFFTDKDERYWGVDLSTFTKFETAIQRLNGMVNPAPPRSTTRRRWFPRFGRRNVSDGYQRPASANSDTGSTEYRPGNLQPMNDEEGNAGQHQAQPPQQIPLVNIQHEPQERYYDGNTVPQLGDIDRAHWERTL